MGDHPGHVRDPEPRPAGRHRHRQAADDDRRDAQRHRGRTSSAWSPAWPTTRWPPPRSSSSGCGSARPTSSRPRSDSSTTPGPPAPGVPSPASASSRRGCWSRATPRSPAPPPRAGWPPTSAPGVDEHRGPMRFGRTLALLGVALAALALGPWVLLVALAALAVPGCGRGCGRPGGPRWPGGRARRGGRPGRGGPGRLAAGPAGPGALVTPGYVGRPAFARPVRVGLPRPPGLAAAAAGRGRRPARGVPAGRHGLVRPGAVRPRRRGRARPAGRPVRGPAGPGPAGDRPRHDAPVGDQGPAGAALDLRPARRHRRRPAATARSTSTSATAPWWPPRTGGCWSSPPRTPRATPT